MTMYLNLNEFYVQLFFNIYECVPKSITLHFRRASVTIKFDLAESKVSYFILDFLNSKVFISFYNVTNILLNQRCNSK